MAEHGVSPAHLSVGDLLSCGQRLDLAVDAGNAFGDGRDAL
jgi:hypothetical protein